MNLASLSLAVVIVLAAAAQTGDAVVVLQEARTLDTTARKSWGARKQTTTMRHVALLQNTSYQSVRALRVTVELYDFFGRLLWAGTAVPTPSTLKPGDVATLSLATPSLESHRTTRYRFSYRADDARR